MRNVIAKMSFAGIVAALVACGGSEPVRGGLPLTRVRTDLTHLRDGMNRYVMLHGVNLSGSTKVPYTVDGKVIGPDQMREVNAKGTPSYVGRPMPPDCAYGTQKAPDCCDPTAADGEANACKWDAADRMWRDVRDAGFNSVRFLVNWEGVEPLRRGEYDAAYLATVRKNVELANKYGIYMLIDMHQDSFSRHLTVSYHELSQEEEPDAIGRTLAALFPPYTDNVRGEGAPRWVVEQCLQEKDLDSPDWGTPRLLSRFDIAMVCDLLALLSKLMPDLIPAGIGPVIADTICKPELIAADPETQRQSLCSLVPTLPVGTLPAWIKPMTDTLCTEAGPKQVAVTGTTDLLPFTNWGLMSMTSVDTARAFFCLMALDPVKKVNPGWPKMKALECRDGTHRPTDFTRCDPAKLAVATKCDDADCKTPREISATEWVQDAYADMWRRVVREVRDLPNVLGYDIINEPNSNAIVLTADAALLMTGVFEGARDSLVGLLGADNGNMLYDILVATRLFPPLKPMAQPVAPEPCDGLPGAWDPATMTGTGELATCQQGWVAYRAAKDKYEKDVADYADEKAQILKDWGLDKLDAMGVIGFNIGFDRNFLKPFYEKVGAAMLDEDPEAVIWVEPTMSIAMVLSGVTQGMWDQSMPPLDLWRCEVEGVKPLDPACPEEARRRTYVYEPHNYADIYPFLGFNQPSRDFVKDEVQFRDYQASMAGGLATASNSLGNVPAIYGEFGTYYNFIIRDKSSLPASEVKENEPPLDYGISESILDNYYEALERMMTSRMLWCYTPNNDFHYGDLWNKEDFSIRGPAIYEDGSVVDSGPWRASAAWARPYARALAGKPVSMHYYSPLHYFDPDKGTPDPVGEFEVVYESRETTAPTEIVIPEPRNGEKAVAAGYPEVADSPYPAGFYVWVSDGTCRYDPVARVLYHFPDADEPGAVHTVRILPPIQGVQNTGWRYFFKGDQVVEGN
jgi:aryl-phospho-beta-D-glucosidase BglC (GH1 family)